MCRPAFVGVSFRLGLTFVFERASQDILRGDPSHSPQDAELLWQALRSEFLLSIPDIEVAVIRIADLLLVSDTFFVCLEHGHLLGLLQGSRTIMFVSAIYSPKYDW